MIEVTAAILIKDNEIFIAQRPENKTMGGKWELPGGKIEPNETGEACIKRELKEELGIAVDHVEHFLTLEHFYEKFSVKLSSYLVRNFKGEIDLKEHKAGSWIKINEALQYDILEADIPVLEKLIERIGD